MAVITPSTDLYLLKVPLEINDINQLDFANTTAQFNYFNSLPKMVVDDFTYQRKDSTIRFPAQYDEVITYNYVMYRNDAYSNKWFYAYITNMEYVNDNMTLITIKSDVWQCWQFDLTYKPCLIDREHTNNDAVGANTLPESLELGELVTNGNVVNFGSTSHAVIIAEVAQVENTGTSSTLSYTWADGGQHDLTPSINGIERGTIPLIVGEFAGTQTGTYCSLDKLVYLYDSAGLSESIVNVYMLPEELVGAYHEIVISTTGITCDGLGVPVDKITPFDMGTNTFTRPTTIQGIVPKNNKCFTYPFCYFNISNNAGTCLPYHYEDFSGNITFKTEGAFGASGNVKTIPIDYKNISASENALDYSISGAKYPICSWKSDSYTNWLTQNAVNMDTQWTSALVGGAFGIGGSAIQGGMQTKGIKGVGFKGGAIAGAAVAGAETIGNLIQVAREQHLARTAANLTSDQVHGNLNAGDFVWAKYKSPFTFLPMSVKAEYLHVIDEYFSQFGYATNRVKVPNIRGRRNWNYVKTTGCYIEAEIPQDDLAEIKGLFDRGVTIWHNPNTFADYSQNNDII